MGRCRFVDMKRWSDPWFHRLTVHAKLLFAYLCDVCDIAGYLEYDAARTHFDTGILAESLDGALKELDKGIVCKDGWIWIKNFLEHQRNLPFKPADNSYIGIKQCIEKQMHRFPDVLDYFEQRGFRGASKGLPSPIGKGKGKGNGDGSSRGSGRGNGNGRGNVEEGGVGEGEGLASNLMEVVEYWNAHCGRLPKVMLPISKEVTKFMCRAMERPKFQKHWKEAIKRATASKFCHGENGGGWFMSFEELVRNDFQINQIMDGEYDNQSNGRAWGAEG